MKNLMYLKTLLLDEYFPQELIALIFAVTVFLLVGIIYGIIKFTIFKRKYFSKKNDNGENSQNIVSSASDDTGGGVENDGDGADGGDGGDD